MIAAARRLPRGPLAIVAAILALFLVAPLILDRYTLSVLVLVLYFAYLGQAWNVMTGFAGLLSIGHALYLGLGAYVSAALFVHFGVPAIVGVIPAMFAAACAGGVVGWLGFRFRIGGVYFALLTIAFAEVARIGFDHFDWTGGAGGLFIPVDASKRFDLINLRGGVELYYYVILALCAGALALCTFLKRSRLGYFWLAIREDEAAARALGIDVFRCRMAAVLLSAAMTALAGTFLAFYDNNLFPENVFSISRSVDLMLAPIVGGLGTLAGPIIGAFILTPLGEILLAATKAIGIEYPGIELVFHGILLVAIIRALPGGVWPWLLRRFGPAAQREGGGP